VTGTLVIRTRFSI